MSSPGWIDYWCNAFTPDRRARWDAAIAAQGIPLQIRTRSDDAFAEFPGGFNPGGGAGHVRGGNTVDDGAMVDVGIRKLFF